MGKIFIEKNGRWAKGKEGEEKFPILKECQYARLWFHSIFDSNGNFAGETNGIVCTKNRRYCDYFRSKFPPIICISE